ncbi:endonuclease/exonuclease/phosphatase family protein [Ferrimonas pelagia]|uniref:Endonuclease/exonuclease/phosphatase domain-containing protein n=1 Tax=Ferrimonas pelagia TaxID=1177826 RepID=A0ABP9F054_9GAMM
MTLLSIRTLAAVALASSAVSLPLSANEQPTISVVQYNIYNGKNIDLITQVLHEQEADLIGLNEVNYKNKRSKGSDQAKHLAEQLTELSGEEWRYEWAHAIPFQGGCYGNAILYNATRLKLHGYQPLTMDDSEGDGMRSSGLGIFELKDEEIYFQWGTLHLTNRNTRLSEEPMMTRQLQQSKAIWGAMEPGLPMLIGGDFNSHVDGPHNPETMAYWMDKGFAVNTPLIPDPAGRSHVIDFNLMKAQGWESIEEQIIWDETAAVASDHAPILTRYRVNARNPEGASIAHDSAASFSPSICPM